MTTETQQMLAALGLLHDDMAAFKQDSVDALAATRAAMGTGFTLLYVDQVNGDDQAAGDAANPIQTFEEAVSRQAYGGQLLVRVVGDYLQDKLLSVRNGSMILRSADVGNRSTITVRSSRTEAANSIYCAGFAPQAGRPAGISFLDIKLAADNDPLPANVTQPAFIHLNAGTTVYLQNTYLDFSSANGQVFGLLQGTAGLTISSVNSPQSLAGDWLYGVAAGTASSTLPQLSTNITTL
ncbi:MAG: hypothetical protein CSA70_03705 [Rhodobacterales bacterium]|nr:MAG: hypothetical protein CSA70_03705 [Rhodobacterales bacterium]